MHRITTRFPARTKHATGFSIIELLVVIAIIFVIIAITVPALSTARKAARRAETANLLTDLSQGVAQFTLDEKRQPGYFSVQEMGGTDNMTQGMSTMQNMMIDMMGGVVPQATPAAGTVVEVGPFAAAANKIKVDHSLIGRKQNNGNKLYWNLPAKVFEKTDSATGEPVDLGQPSRIGTHKKIREVVDAFGAPILCWASDETLTTPIANINDFVLEQYNTAVQNSPRARVYWAQNSAFLSSTVAAPTFLGTRQLDQRGPSMINKPAAPNGTHLTTLMGMLGNPGSPKNPTEPNLQNILPTSQLASVVFQSAGVDGYFLSRSDKGSGGARIIDSDYTVLDYGANVRNKVLSKFDDLLQGAN